MNNPLVTEQQNRFTRNLDQKTALEIVTLINQEDKKIVSAIQLIPGRKE